MPGVWNLTLYVCHSLAFFLAFCIGISLILKQNNAKTALFVIESVRDDQAMIHPSERSVTNEDSPPENAVRAIWNCLLVCGALCLIISFLIAINLYCFLAMMLKTSSPFMERLPLLMTLRQKMQQEAIAAGLDRLDM